MTTIKYIAAARIPDRCRFAEFTLLESREIPRAVFDEKLDKVLVSSHLKNNTRLTITDDIGHIHYEADPAFIYLGTSSPLLHSLKQDIFQNVYIADTSSFNIVL